MMSALEMGEAEKSKAPILAAPVEKTSGNSDSKLLAAANAHIPRHKWRYFIKTSYISRFGIRDPSPKIHGKH